MQQGQELNKNNTENLTPFVKWVGGKRQLLKELENIFLKFETYNKYHEPFVGGGAVFVNQLLNGKDIGSINDLNVELMNAYRVIKNEPHRLMKQLDELENLHSRLLFYHIRSLDKTDSLKNESAVFKAARFIYLNKTSFNGIYRVNSKNHFNVPIGSLGSVNIYSKDNISNFSKYLNATNIQILNDDYHYILTTANSGDLVYFDPPYDSFESSSNFVGYQAKGFTRKDQEELKSLCDKLIDKGVNVVVSNHGTEFIKSLYSNKQYYFQEVVSANRNINSNPKKRGKAPIELIIYGFGKGKNG